MARGFFALVVLLFLSSIISAYYVEAKNPLICPVAPVRSYMDIYVESPPPLPPGGITLMKALVYNLTGDYNKTPISNGLVFLVNQSDRNAPQICYLVTDVEGNAKITYKDDFEGCMDYRFVFCPKAEAVTSSNPDTAKQARQMCLNGTVSLSHQSLINNPIQRCLGTPTTPDPENKDPHLASHNTLYLCNQTPKNFSGLCWPIMLIMGILVGASFLVGKNPFMAFDLSSPRMNRGKQYTMRAQQRSFDLLTYGFAAQNLSQSVGEVGMAIFGTKKSVFKKKVDKETGKVTYEKRGNRYVGGPKVFSTLASRGVLGLISEGAGWAMGHTVKGIEKIFGGKKEPTLVTTSVPMVHLIGDEKGVVPYTPSPGTTINLGSEPVRPKLQSIASTAGYSAGNFLEVFGIRGRPSSGEDFQKFLSSLRDGKTITFGSVMSALWKLLKENFKFDLTTVQNAIDSITSLYNALGVLSDWSMGVGGYFNIKGMKGGIKLFEEGVRDRGLFKFPGKSGHKVNLGEGLKWLQNPDTMPYGFSSLFGPLIGAGKASFNKLISVGEQPETKSGLGNDEFRVYSDGSVYNIKENRYLNEKEVKGWIKDRIGELTPAPFLPGILSEEMLQKLGYGEVHVKIENGKHDEIKLPELERLNKKQIEYQIAQNEFIGWITKVEGKGDDPTKSETKAYEDYKKSVDAYCDKEKDAKLNYITAETLLEGVKGYNDLNPTEQKHVDADLKNLGIVGKQDAVRMLEGVVEYNEKTLHNSTYAAFESQYQQGLHKVKALNAMQDILDKRINGTEPKKGEDFSAQYMVEKAKYDTYAKLENDAAHYEKLLVMAGPDGALTKGYEYSISDETEKTKMRIAITNEITELRRQVNAELTQKNPDRVKIQTWENELQMKMDEKNAYALIGDIQVKPAEVKNYYLGKDAVVDYVGKYIENGNTCTSVLSTFTDHGFDNSLTLSFIGAVNASVDSDVLKFQQIPGIGRLQSILQQDSNTVTSLNIVKTISENQGLSKVAEEIDIYQTVNKKLITAMIDPENWREDGNLTPHVQALLYMAKTNKLLLQDPVNSNINGAYKTAELIHADKLNFVNSNILNETDWENREESLKALQQTSNMYLDAVKDSVDKWDLTGSPFAGQKEEMERQMKRTREMMDDIVKDKEFDYEKTLVVNKVLQNIGALHQAMTLTSEQYVEAQLHTNKGQWMGQSAYLKDPKETYLEGITGNKDLFSRIRGVDAGYYEKKYLVTVPTGKEIGAPIDGYEKEREKERVVPFANKDDYPRLPEPKTDSEWRPSFELEKERKENEPKENKKKFKK